MRGPTLPKTHLREPESGRQTSRITEAAKIAGPPGNLTRGVMIAILALSPILALQAAGGSPQPAENVQVFEVRHTAAFSEDALVFEKRQGYDTVYVAGTDWLQKAGKPMLPAQTLRIALPAGMSVTDVQIAAINRVELAGEHGIFPAQPPRLLSGGHEREFVEPDPAVYISSEAYPSQWVRFLGQADLAGQNIGMIRVYPLRYVPAGGKLTLATSIEIVLKGVSGHECGDYLPPNVSAHARAVYERMLRGAVVNPHDVALRTASDPAPVRRSVGPGEYEYVIITCAEWAPDFQRLADWRIRRGIRSTIVTTEWIYGEGGYSGSELEMIRAFIVDAHDNWGATHFLLGGDTDVIPYHTRSITVPDWQTDSIPNDTYFADYDEDWVCEVHLARAPVRKTIHLTNFVDKILGYEKSPPLSDYVKSATFFGFDIEAGDHYGEACSERVRTTHLPGPWAFDVEYDSEPGTHKTDMMDYLNQGPHLVIHNGHCNTTCIDAGYMCHGDIVVLDDVRELDLGDRRSILFATGCFPCDFPAQTSIGELFVRRPKAGGIAFMGNTRYGWGGGGDDSDFFSIRQQRYFYRNLFDDGFERLGENFSDLKNDAFDPNDPYNLHQYCFTQMHLLGDPEVPVWTEDPQSLTVTHGEALEVGEYTTFTVEVGSGGDPVDQATVCLWKGGDVYEVEHTLDGSANFGVTPSTTGDMYVTVTCRNCLPYEGQAVIRLTGDLDSDSDVDLADVAQLLGHYGMAGGATYEQGDVDGDDDVDAADLVALLAAYGATWP